MVIKKISEMTMEEQNAMLEKTMRRWDVTYGAIPVTTAGIPDKFAYEAAPAIAASADANFVSRETYAFLHNRYMLALDEVRGLRAKVAATAPDATKIADEIMSRIERDRDYHGASISRDALIDVAVMCGCKKPA